MAKTPTANRATFIGYQAPTNFVDFGGILKGYQAATEVGQTQRLKDQVKQRSVYDKAAGQLQDFTTDISPNLQQFVGESLGGIRDQMFNQYELYTNGGDNATHNQLYMNNAVNEFKAFAQYGKDYQKVLENYEKRSQGKASLLETNYFSVRYASQADFRNKKMALDKDGHLWIMSYDDNGKLLDKETMSINQLNNVQSLQSDKVTFSDYTAAYSKNIAKFKTEYEDATKEGKTITLEGLANNYSGGAKEFNKMYQGTVDAITESLLTQPNVGAAALTETLAPDGMPYFFYNTEAKDGSPFSLDVAGKGRSKEYGIYMQRDSDLHERAKLTDDQKELLRGYVSENLDAQIGFNKGISGGAGYLKKLNKNQQFGNDLLTALRLRNGDVDEWGRVLGSYNDNVKDDEKILSFRVDPDGVFYTTAGGTDDRITLYGGRRAFTGKKADESIIKDEITSLLRIVDPKTYDSVVDAKNAYDNGKDFLPIEAKQVLDAGFSPTKGKYTEADLQTLQRSMLTQDFGFAGNERANPNSVGMGVKDFLDYFSKGTSINFNPVSGRDEIDKSPIVGVKTYYVDATGNRYVMADIQQPGANPPGISGNAYMSNFKEKVGGELMKTLGKGDPIDVITEITILDSDGNRSPYTFTHDYRGADASKPTSPSTGIVKRNEEAFSKMIQYAKEGVRDKGAYADPAVKNLSPFYEEGIFDFRQ